MLTAASDEVARSTRRQVTNKQIHINQLRDTHKKGEIRQKPKKRKIKPCVRSADKVVDLHPFRRLPIRRLSIGQLINIHIRVITCAHARRSATIECYAAVFLQQLLLSSSSVYFVYYTMPLLLTCLASTILNSKI